MGFVARHHEARQRENSAIRGFARLSEEETRAGIAALEQVAPGSGSDIQVIRRLGRRNDGVFLLGIDFPLYRLREPDSPWANRLHEGDGLAFGLQYEAIEIGIPVLQSESSPTREVERRQMVMERAKQQTQTNERAGELEREAAAREQAAREKRAVDFDKAGFDRLHPWQRLCVRLALIIPEHGAAIRALMRDHEGRGDTGPRWPDCPWK